MALQAVWEEGLRAVGRTAESRWTAQAKFQRASEPGFELRPGDIEIGSAVTADFEVEPGSTA